MIPPSFLRVTLAFVLLPAALSVGCGGGSDDPSSAANPSAANASTQAPSLRGWEGLYETETAHRSWAIRIRTETPFRFEVVAGHLEDTSEYVDAPDLGGYDPGGQQDVTGLDSVSFDDLKGDCHMVLTRIQGGIHVTQSDTCASLGFPEDGDLAMDADFTRLDEVTECFDKKQLSVGASLHACADPL